MRRSRVKKSVADSCAPVANEKNSNMRQYIWRKCSLQILSRLIGPKRGNAQSASTERAIKLGAGGKQVKQLITAWQIAPPWRGEYENCNIKVMHTEKNCSLRTVARPWRKNDENSNMKAVRTIEKLLVVDTCPIDRAETARYCAAGKQSKLKMLSVYLPHRRI